MKKIDENSERRKEILAELEELEKKMWEDIRLEYFDRYHELREELFSLLPRETKLNQFRRQMHQAWSDGGSKFILWFAVALCVMTFFSSWYDIFGRTHPETGIFRMIFSIVIASFLLWILTYPKDDGVI